MERTRYALRDNARLTKDIDLGLRDEVLDADELRDRLVEALGEDPDGDRFVLTVGPAKTMVEDGSGLPTWRVKVKAELAGKLFGRIQVDVSPRVAELSQTDLVQLPNSLEFAEVMTPQVEIIDVHRHAAEKSHQARVIDLDPATTALLRRHRERQQRERDELGVDYNDLDLVTCAEDGNPIHPQSFSQAFATAVARAGLRTIRLHDLRHTHATIAVKAGVPVKVLSERLGHESPAFTLKQYAQVPRRSRS